MKTYKLKSSAVRAAKKEMGEKWMEFATIEAEGKEFTIELKPTSTLTSTIEAVQLMADQSAADAEKADKKAEIESRKPVHIPSTPLTSIVKKESAPAPKPSLPAFLKKAPPTESEVPEFKIAGPDSPEFLAAQQAQADKQANIEAVNKDSAKPRLSTTEKPTKKVWHIADEMLMVAQKAGEPMPKRKDVIEECVRQGIAYGTSRTQYQHWFKCYNDSLATPIATIGKDGKIVPPQK